MSSKNIFKLFKIFLVAVILSAVILSGCSKTLEPVPATLKGLIKSYVFRENAITLIRNTGEFENFLGNEDLFEEEFSEEFKAVNARYDGEFFESNYLVAIIEWASIYTTTGHKLRSITKTDGVLHVEIDAIYPHKRYLNQGMGKRFTYYLTVDKDETLTGAQIKVNN